MAKSLAYSEIRGGDRVYFLSPLGVVRSGAAVMRGPAGWVVNTGGKYGTPAVVPEASFVRATEGKSRFTFPGG